MDSFFDLDGLLADSASNVGDRGKLMQFSRMHFRKLDSLKKLAGSLPKENEVYFLETANSFNAFTFVVYLIKEAGVIDDMFIATYSINLRILHSLAKWMDKGMIKKVHIYIAGSIKQRMPKVVEAMEGFSLSRDWRVSYSWTHKKVLCAKIGDRHFVVEGSGNFSENAAEEQYIFTQSKELYGFRRGGN